ncbi:MAG: T9SS type A sorting domain-containing protein [Algoriphagus sp.]|nr:T9SS type A sorting domain-containing protein [Algoriphagus sp.]
MLTLYPNPAEQVLVVAIRDSLLEIAPADASFTASLYSITGQLIETKTLASEYDYMATRFEVGHLAPGTYIVRAQVGPIPYSGTFVKR